MSPTLFAGMPAGRAEPGTHTVGEGRLAAALHRVHRLRTGPLALRTDITYDDYHTDA
jgi:hypothetical protein